jgi:murein endopeptidase
MLFKLGARCVLAMLLAAPVASAAETSAAPVAAVVPSLAGPAAQSAQTRTAATEEQDVQPAPAQETAEPVAAPAVPEHAAAEPAAPSAPAAKADAPSETAVPEQAAAAEPEGAADSEDIPSEAAAAAKQAVVDPGLRYTSDLTDEALARVWKENPEALGSVSVGFADQGRLINAVHLEDGDAWTVARRDLSWGTRETIDGLVAAFRAVHEEYPDARARLSHIGLQSGGWLRPHKSHQSGRDADLGFFYKGNGRPGGRLKNVLKAFDTARNWALIRALVTQSDVQIIWVDRGIQKVLRDHALKIGEDRAWVDRLFRAGNQSLLQHARRHQDHFHVRFYAPRSQELGRRLQPLLAQRPEHNLTFHKVQRGQTLGHIAKKYGVTVASLQKANHLGKKSFLSSNQRLLVPLRGPCTKCPLPPPVEVPPRCLPPVVDAATAGTMASGGPGKNAALAQ